MSNGVIAFCVTLAILNGVILPAKCNPDAWVQELSNLRGQDLELLEPYKEDPEWADYINDIEPEYDEIKGFPVETTINPKDNFFNQKLNWSLTGRGEVPFLAVIYQLLDNENVLDKGAMWGVSKNRACGGILVSPDRLITNCQCVMSYFATTMYPTVKIAEEDAPPLYPYDLGWRTKQGKYQINGKLNRIYVQYGVNRLITGKEMPGLKSPLTDMHLIDGMEHASSSVPKLTTSQDCGKCVEAVWLHGVKPKPYTSGSRVGELPEMYLMQNTLALVPFWPRVSHPVPGQFVPWPPQVFSDLNTQYAMSLQYKNLEQVTVTGIGFQKVTEAPCSRQWKLLDDEGVEIPLERQAINMHYLHCINAPRDGVICRGNTVDQKYSQLSCFCDLYQPTAIGRDGCKSIANGVLGWPIIYQGDVVALTASPRSAELPGGLLLGSSLGFKPFKEHVEATLTKGQMWRDRTPRPPMFREDIAPADNFVFYDYPEQPQWFSHMGTTPKMVPLGLSRALDLRPRPKTLLVPLMTSVMYQTPFNILKGR